MKIKVNGKGEEAYALVMRKENALEILQGKKTVEIRPLTPKYEGMFIDKDMVMHNEHLREVGAGDECEPPYRIDIAYVHFYNYQNSWSLDVEIDEIGMTEMTQEGVAFLNKEFDFHDFDNEWQQFEDKPMEEIPLFFYLHICRIVSHRGLE